LATIQGFSGFGQVKPDDFWQFRRFPTAREALDTMVLAHASLRVGMRAR